MHAKSNGVVNHLKNAGAQRYDKGKGSCFIYICHDINTVNGNRQSCTCLMYRFGNHISHKIGGDFVGIVCNIHNIVCKTGITNDQLQANGTKATACDKSPSGIFILAASSSKRKWSHRRAPGLLIRMWIFQIYNHVAMCSPWKMCSIHLHLNIDIVVYSENSPDFSNNPTVWCDLLDGEAHLTPIEVEVSNKVHFLEEASMTSVAGQP